VFHLNRHEQPLRIFLPYIFFFTSHNQWGIFDIFLWGWSTFLIIFQALLVLSYIGYIITVYKCIIIPKYINYVVLVIHLGIYCTITRFTSNLWFRWRGIQCSFINTPPLPSHVSKARVKLEIRKRIFFMDLFITHCI